MALALAGPVLLVACTAGDDGSATDGGASEDASTATADDGSDRPGESSANPPDGPVAAPVRHPAIARPIYFVLPDRFANGDPSNDRAGVAVDDPLLHGFLPSDRGFHHGGDLAGLLDNLDYLEGLGVGALWITPPFGNRWVQGDGTRARSTSSYHGYWITDFTGVDAHLGTDDELRALVEAAHARDIDVYLDVVVNHTGDVIRLAERPVYVGTGSSPYRDADGEPFDLADVAGTDAFPTLDPGVSFPYEPTFSDPVDATAKSPAWLNDVTRYHNRGDSTFSGESAQLGDFFGLDDLFTEDPFVIEGMTQVYADVLADFGVDGYRVDTVKHVNDELWARFFPGVRAAAAAAGEPDFFVFGEVFSSDPILQSGYTNLGASATLDFIVDDALAGFVAGGDARVMVDAFDDDDWFTDADNNASMQVTFFGNHDEGRMGATLATAVPGADEAELLDRMRLGFDLLFTIRGVPVVYYGDEQGLTGDGGDQLARQSMFPSQVPEYLDDDLLGTDRTHADDNLDPDHPLYGHVAELSALRAGTPALVTGAMLVHELATDAPPTVFAFSRLDRDERVEHVVVANAADDPATVTVPTMTPDAPFVAVHGQHAAVASDADGTLEVTVPARDLVVLRADGVVVDFLREDPEVTLVRPAGGTEIPTRRYRVEAEVAGDRYAEVTFAVGVDGADPIVVGVDDAAPYRVYWNSTALPGGAEVEVLATVSDGSGRFATDRVTVTLGVRDR